MPWPDQTGSISVVVGGKPLRYDPSGTNGWLWGDEQNGEIVLVGDTCASVGAGAITPSAEVACGPKQ